MLNRELLFKYSSGISIETGSMLAYYSFSEVVPRQSHKIFNTLYTTGDNFGTGEYLNLSKYAGVSMGVRNNPVSGKIVGAGRNLITGSGYFDSTDLIKVGSGVGVGSWTAFFSYSGIGHSEGFEKVLLSSCGTPTDASGFSLGISDNNFVCVKNFNALGRSSLDLPGRYAGQNIVSLSRDSETKVSTIGKHNIYEEDHTYRVMSDSEFSKSDQWYIGQHSKVDTYDKALLHRTTGFKGYIDDFVLFSGSLSNTQKEKFSQVFALTGYTPVQTGFLSGYYSGVVSATTGLGVVGQEFSGYRYEMVPTVDRIGNTIESLKQIEVYKDKIGQVIIYATGEQYVEVTGTVFPETLEFDSDKKKRFGLNSIVFQKASGHQTIVDYYNQGSISNNVNLRVKPIRSTEESGVGFVTDFDGVADSFNVFVSGLYKSPKPVNIIGSSASFSSYTNGSDSFQTGVYEFKNVMTGQSYTFDPAETANALSVVGVGLSGSVHSNVVVGPNASTVTPLINKLVFFHKTPTSAADRFTSFPAKLTPIYDHDYVVEGSGKFHPVSTFGYKPEKVSVDSTSSNEVLYHNFNHHQSGNITAFDGSGYIDKDVYLDGVKLFSGSDYDKFDGRFRLKKLVPGAGDKKLFFVPRATSDFSMASGVLAPDKVTFDAGVSLLDEQVWRDGRREKKRVDYSTRLQGGAFTSAAEVSTVSTTGNYHIFDGSSSGYFNRALTSVQDHAV
jgi:hypothetical protein